MFAIMEAYVYLLVEGDLLKIGVAGSILQRAKTVTPNVDWSTLPRLRIR